MCVCIQEIGMHGSGGGDDDDVAAQAIGIYMKCAERAVLVSARSSACRF